MRTLYTILFLLAVAIWGYLLGSISFARILCQAKGVDITKLGSGNPGGTNVWRNLGWKFGLPCMLLDMLKGFLATFTVLCLVLFVPSLKDGSILYDFKFQDQAQWNIYPMVAGLFASIGHAFPLYYHFKGGKNVMVVSGAIIATSPQLFLLGFVVFAIVLLSTKKVAPASLSSAIAIILLGLIPVFLTGFRVPGYQYMGMYFNPDSFFLFDWISYLFYLFSACLVIVRHKSNIEKIMKHQDKRDF